MTKHVKMTCARSCTETQQTIKSPPHSPNWVKQKKKTANSNRIRIQSKINTHIINGRESKFQGKIGKIKLRKNNNLIKLYWHGRNFNVSMSARLALVVSFFFSFFSFSACKKRNFFVRMFFVAVRPWHVQMFRFFVTHVKWPFVNLK